jgi:hypothetical protein
LVRFQPEALNILTQNKIEMEQRRTINGYTFKWDNEHEMYECRGALYYDDDHDEVPEPELWKAALILEKQLGDEGRDAEANYSEKGWVEVVIL